MPTIGLTQGQRTRVDWQDYRALAELKWYAHWNRSNQSFYATRKGPRPSKDENQLDIKMAREIVGLERGDKREVDHINHDTLDNRRRNLRVVSRRENLSNRKDQSPYGVGVTRRPRHKQPNRPYDARARLGPKRHHLGSFATPEEAREARRCFLEACDGPE